MESRRKFLITYAIIQKQKTRHGFNFQSLPIKFNCRPSDTYHKSPPLVRCKCSIIRKLIVNVYSWNGRFFFIIMTLLYSRFRFFFSTFTIRYSSLNFVLSLQYLYLNNIIIRLSNKEWSTKSNFLKDRNS